MPLAALTCRFDSSTYGLLSCPGGVGISVLVVMLNLSPRSGTRRPGIRRVTGRRWRSSWFRHLVQRFRLVGAEEVLRVRGAVEVLAHQLRPEQYRAQRPVVDDNPGGLAGLVE